MDEWVIQMEREIILNRTSPESQPQPTRPDRQDRALYETLGAVRLLRDEYFREDMNSRAGLLLGQVCLVLERLHHGIPSGRETFDSLLRVAGAAEQDPVQELVEA